MRDCWKDYLTMSLPEGVYIYIYIYIYIYMCVRARVCARVYRRTCHCVVSNKIFLARYLPHLVDVGSLVQVLIVFFLFFHHRQRSPASIVVCFLT